VRREWCGQNAAHQSLIATVDGKKCELESLDMANALLMLGDYKARLVKDQHWAGPYDSYRVYELFFRITKSGNTWSWVSRNEPMGSSRIGR
jgi:hypothetical protein